MRKTESDSDTNSGLLVVVSEERVGSTERIVCVCWRDETTSSTVVLGEEDIDREEASVVVRRREIVTKRREKNRAEAIVSGEGDVLCLINGREKEEEKFYL